MLQKSMREDGFTQPIIAHAKTKQIVDGEHRWRAAQAIGMEKIPVVFVDMDLAQMKISTLRHNRARGSEDIELTAQLMRDLEALGAREWMQDSLQLDDVEMDRLINEISASEALAGEEFNLAWEPEIAGMHGDLPLLGDEAVEGTTTVIDGQGMLMDTAMSIEAANRIRSRQKQIAEAKSEEERQTLRRESDLYRLTLIFAGDEGALVKSVLGKKPAPKLVEMCRRWMDKGFPIGDEGDE